MKEKKNKLIFWGIIVLVVIMCALIFVPMFTMRGSMSDAVAQVNEKYNDEFTMTWTNIDDRPMSNTFIAIMKSNTTGVTYNASSVDGVMTIDEYELESFNAQINQAIETALANTFAMSVTADDALQVRLFTIEPIAEATLASVMTDVKEQFNLSTVTVETMQITETQLTEAKEQIGEYYQRSTVAKEETFDSYEPIRTTYTF